jgi:lipoate-protein ligase A
MGQWDVYAGEMDAATHLALDELLFARAKQGKYTLLLPEYHQPMLVLAHDQHAADYIGNGAREYTRAFTSGGAMLCDKNVFPFSMAVPRSATAEDYRKDPVETHKYFGGIINRILQSLGVHDTVMGEKFYIKVKRTPHNLPLVGTSQRVETDALLYHGIITLDPWDADELSKMLRLRTRDSVREYDKIQELPYVRAYCDLPLDDLKSDIRAQLAEQVAGTQELLPVPADLQTAAEKLVRDVYRNDQWRNDAQHPSWSQISSNHLKEGLGFCLLGSEFQ